MTLSDDPVTRRAQFNEIIYQGCVRFGGSVVSGVRSPARNASVGGHVDSRHTCGLADDLAFDTERLAGEAFRWFYQQGLHGYRKGNRRYMHVQDRGAPAPT